MARARVVLYAECNDSEDAAYDSCARETQIQHYHMKALEITIINELTGAVTSVPSV